MQNFQKAVWLWVVKANPWVAQCLLAGADVCPGCSCPEGSAAEWPLRDLLSTEPADGSKAALEEVQASNARSKRNKDFCWFWWSSSPLSDQWPMKEQVSPLLAPFSSSGRVENAFLWGSARRRHCTTLSMERGKYLFWQVSQGFQRESANTCNKLSSYISSYW